MSTLCSQTLSHPYKHISNEQKASLHMTFRAQPHTIQHVIVIHEVTLRHTNQSQAGCLFVATISDLFYHSLQVCRVCLQNITRYKKKRVSKNLKRILFT